MSKQLSNSHSKSLISLFHISTLDTYADSDNSTSVLQHVNSNTFLPTCSFLSQEDNDDNGRSFYSRDNVVSFSDVNPIPHFSSPPSLDSTSSHIQSYIPHRASTKIQKQPA